MIAIGYCLTTRTHPGYKSYMHKRNPQDTNDTGRSRITTDEYTNGTQNNMVLVNPAMRPRISWMTRGDDYILQFFIEADIAASPNVIGYNTEYSRQYVARRCKTLSEGGLLDRVDEGKAMYRITAIGRKYIHDELSEDEIREIETAVD